MGLPKDPARIVVGCRVGIHRLRLRDVVPRQQLGRTQHLEDAERSATGAHV
jgi:hypothetical protein